MAKTVPVYAAAARPGYDRPLFFCSKHEAALRVELYGCLELSGGIQLPALREGEVLEPRVPGYHAAWHKAPSANVVVWQMRKRRSTVACG